VTEAAEEILRRARAVPAGFVTTYGDLSPAAPRAAGAAQSNLHVLSDTAT
jgi:alkylated DNA nucleotide flippase Atl1